MREWIAKVSIVSVVIIEFILSICLCSGEKYSAWPIFIGFLVGDVVILYIIGLVTSVSEEETSTNKLEDKWARFSIEDLGGLADKGNNEAWKELVKRFREIEESKPKPVKMSLEEAVGRSLAGENIDISNALSSKEN